VPDGNDGGADDRIAVALLAVLVGTCCEDDGVPAFAHFTSITIADLNDDHLPDLVSANVFVAGDLPHPSHVTVLCA
jgi:hypothetical protein